MAQGQPTPEGQDGDLADDGDGGQQRLKTGLVAHGPHPRPVEDGRPVDQVGQLPVFLTEALDHPHPGDRLLHHGGHFALPLLGFPVGREGAGPHPVGGDHQQGDDHQADQRQQRRVHEHDDQRGGQQQDVARHERQEGQQALQQPDIGVGPRHQLAGLHLVVAGEVEMLQLVEDGVAQVELDVQADPTAPVAADVGGGERSHRGGRQDEQPRPQRGTVGLDDVVDNFPFDGRNGRGDPAAHQGRPEGQDHVAPMGTQPRQEPPDPARFTRGAWLAGGACQESVRVKNQHERRSR